MSQAKDNYICTIQGCDREWQEHAVLISLYSTHADLDQDTPYINKCLITCWFNIAYVNSDSTKCLFYIASLASLVDWCAWTATESESSAMNDRRDASIKKTLKIKCSRQWQLNIEIKIFYCTKLLNLGAMANIPTMDQYLSLLKYFLIIAIVKMKDKDQ